MANIRRIALKLLEGWERDGTYLNLALNSPAVAPLDRAERAQLTALLYGTVERKLTLDYLISSVARRSELAPHTRNALRLGLYQLYFMDRVPNFAVVNETVSLGLSQGERGFINGVLRASLRAYPDAAHLPYPPREKSLARHLSVAHSVPLPIVRHFLALLGEEEGERLLASLNRTAPTTLAVNTLKISRDAFLAMLREAGLEAEKTSRSPVGIRLLSAIPIPRIPGFDEGLFFVEDEASQLVAEALDAREGELLIDTCACPGGKSFSAAIRMRDTGRILSFDIHESKLPLISDGAARLGLGSIEVGERDATDPDQSLFGVADRVLCDAPCSGLGVLSKKPDLRYLPLQRLSELPPLQLKILRSVSQYVRPGGRILYSTCTLNRDENEGVFLKFLEENPEFRPLDFTVSDLSSSDGMLTLYPHIHRTDGFFMALAVRDLP